jgi:hypothetical protein
LVPAEFVAQDVEAVDELEVEEVVVGEPEDTARLPVEMLVTDELGDTALTARKPATRFGPAVTASPLADLNQQTPEPMPLLPPAYVNATHLESLSQLFIQSFQEVGAMLLAYALILVSELHLMKKRDPPWDVTNVCVSASGQSWVAGLARGRTLEEVVAATAEEVLELLPVVLFADRTPEI